MSSPAHSFGDTLAPAMDAGRYRYPVGDSECDLELEAQIKEATDTLKTAKASADLPRYGLAAALIVAGFLAGFVLPHVLFGKDAPELQVKLLVKLGLMLTFSGSVMLATVPMLKQSRIRRLETDLALLNARRRVARRLKPQTSSTGLGSGPGASYFDKLVSINVENLAAYYTLVKVHTDKSFTTAVVAGVVGFALLVLGLVIGCSGPSDAALASYFTMGSGLMIEFIAGVFFVMYNRTVSQMKGYHDSLLTVQNVLLSFKLVGDVTSEAERVKMVGQMLAYLIGGKLDARGGLTQHSRPVGVLPVDAATH